MATRKPTTKSLEVGQTKPPIIRQGAKIIAIDPGLTTGVCCIIYRGAKDFDVQCTLEIPWEKRHSIRAHIIGVDFIVIERFALYQSKARTMVNDEFPSVWMSGIVDSYAKDLNLADAIYIQPAHLMANVAIDPKHIKIIGGDSEHKKDSYKHARYFIIVNRNNAT